LDQMRRDLQVPFSPTFATSVLQVTMLLMLL
jgi:hypothetical protein